MLQQFLPLLALTFAVCWFVVIMQFMWRYVDDFIGKGIALSTLGHVLIFAAEMVLPTALPLGILLASLMTFGGMGERLELLAIKSSGTPLHKVMIPLFFTSLLLGVGLFVYLNTVVMEAQVKFYQIAFSARQKQPDLEIPEGSFYNGITNYNLYVQKKDHKHRTLRGILIYDMSNGFNETRIIRADSGKLTMDLSKTFLTLDLYNGESFQNLKESITPNKNSNNNNNLPKPFIKEHFQYKQIVIPFDANFKLQSDDDLRNQFVGKNLFQLNKYIQDTARYALDSVGIHNAKILMHQVNNARYADLHIPDADTTKVWKQAIENLQQQSIHTQVNIDSLLQRANVDQRIAALSVAVSRLQNLSSESQFRDGEYEWQAYYYRTHDQERHRKFTFPAACIIFFFIGAPLGSIIRKGGIGTPMVTSVLLFIVYYMIDTYGYKMGYTGQWPVWIGMWLSTFALLPLGIFLTYQATRDSSSLNLDAIISAFKEFFNPKKKRAFRIRELIINEMSNQEAVQHTLSLSMQTDQLLHLPFISKGKPSFANLRNLQMHYKELKNSTNQYATALLDNPTKGLPTKLAELPLQRASFTPLFGNRHWLYILLVPLLPISLALICYLYTIRKKERARLKKQIEILRNIKDLLLENE